MSKTVISKSGKKRFPARYIYSGKEINRETFPRRFQMVVYHEPAGYRKKNGQLAMISHTRHEIVD